MKFRNALPLVVACAVFGVGCSGPSDDDGEPGGLNPPPPPAPPPPPPAAVCAATAPTGRLTQASADAPFVYTTSAGWTITIVKGSSITVTYPPGHLTYDSWGSASDASFPQPVQHENFNGKHVKDWLLPRRTLLIPGGTKLTIASVDHAIAAGVYPVFTVSIYDVDQTHRIDEQTHRVTRSCAIANFEEVDEYDGETARFVAESGGWLFEQQYIQRVSTSGTVANESAVYPLARIYNDSPNRVDDYYDDTRLGST